MNDDLHLLTGAYAVDALDADERHRFERHLAGCADCQTEVAGFHEATASLAAALPTTTPPAGLRAAVLAEVDRTRQVTVLAARTSRHASRAPWLAVAAAAFVAVGLGALLLDARGRIDDLEDIEQLALAADATTVSLDGDSSMRVTWSASLGQGILVASDLVEPGERSDYQLWIVSEGQPRSLGVFDPNNGSVELHFDDVPQVGDVVAVTIEPDGGSASPTTDPVRATSVA